MNSKETKKENKSDIRRAESADVWFRDGLKVCNRAGGFLSIDVRMDAVVRAKKYFAGRGHRVTYTPFFIQAVAKVLSKHRELHQLVSGDRIWKPDDVNIGLSVAGDSFLAPVLVIEKAENKSITDTSDLIRTGKKKAQREQKDFMESLNKWGRWVPFGFVRRFLIRFFTERILFGRKHTPTFQVSILRDVQQFSPLLLGTNSLLAVGRIEDRPVVEYGKVIVRPMVTLTCCIDHKVWDGATAQIFMTKVKDFLEDERIFAAAVKTETEKPTRPHYAISEN